MLLTITIPVNDYRAIERYLKKGVITMPEVIGRVYTISTLEDVSAMAEIMTGQPAIVYSLSYFGDEFFQIGRQMSCRFEALGISIAFEMDSGYD